MGRDTALKQQAARLEKKRIRELAAAADLTDQTVTDASPKSAKKAKKNKKTKKYVSKHEQQQSSKDPAVEPSGGDDDGALEEAPSTRKTLAKLKREKSQKKDGSMKKALEDASSGEGTKSPQADSGSAKSQKKRKLDKTGHPSPGARASAGKETTSGDDDGAPEEAPSTRKTLAKLKREKSQKKDGSMNKAPEEASSREGAKSPQAGNGSAKSQKKRKLDKSGDSSPSAHAGTGTETVGDKGSNKKQKKAHSAYKYTCFFGQLPYDITKEDLDVALKGAGVEKAMVRLLTDKVTNKFRGIAFVDMLTEADRKKALKLHHTKLNGRQINVERVTFQPGSASEKGKDVKGGGEHQKKAGKDRPRYSKKLEKDQVEELVRNEVAASRGLLKREDFDDKNMSFLGLLDRDVVEEALKVASKKAKNTNIKNRQAYLMGVILRVANKARAAHPKQSAPSGREDE